MLKRADQLSPEWGFLHPLNLFSQVEFFRVMKGAPARGALAVLESIRNINKKRPKKKSLEINQKLKLPLKSTKKLKISIETVELG